MFIFRADQFGDIDMVPLLEGRRERGVEGIGVITTLFSASYRKLPATLLGAILYYILMLALIPLFLGVILCLLVILLVSLD